MAHFIIQCKPLENVRPGFLSIFLNIGFSFLIAFSSPWLSKPAEVHEMYLIYAFAFLKSFAETLSVHELSIQCSIRFRQHKNFAMT